MTATTSDPKIRVRINHSRTQRDGWRHETTVEVDEYSAPDGADLYRMCRELLQDLDSLARAENERRNALDAQEVAS